MPRRLTYGLAAAFLFLVTVSASAQEVDFGQLSEQITKDLRKKGLDSAVVFAFRGPGTEETSLGVRLAEDFSSALRGVQKPLTVIERNTLGPLVEKHQFQADHIRQIGVACWLSNQAGAKALVAGFFEVKGELVVLTVHGYDTWSAREIAKRKTEIAVTQGLRDLASLQLQPPPTPPGSEVSESQEASSVARSGTDVGYPMCKSCPNPTYTEEARRARLSCTILLRVIVTKEGTATDIRVVRPCPLGLTEKAIETLRKWRFKPATRKDGTPVDAWTPIEINFRIYDGPGIFP